MTSHRTFLLTLALLAAAAPLSAMAQGRYTAPKNSFGQPDITGSWSNATLTPTTRPPLYGTRGTHSAEEVAILEGASRAKEEAGNAPVDVNLGAGGSSGNVGAYDQGWVDNSVKIMRVNGEPRTSLITTPDGMAPVRRGGTPRTPPAGAGSVEAGLRAAQQTAQSDMFAGQGNVAAAARPTAYDNPEVRGAGERCLTSFGRNAGPPMFPNGWYNNNYQIVQGKDSVVIVVEMVHDARVIRLNSEHRRDGVRPWFGDSIGWYEGNTLVVETTNVPQRMAYNGSWENLKVTERFTRVANDRVLYKFTVEDATMWDAPWGGEYEFHALNGRLYEYACHEGNYALEGVLAGAREAERQAAAPGPQTAR